MPIIEVPDLPLPGHGSTRRRLWGLAALGRADLVSARLGEGHADAVAIRAELGDENGETPTSGRWGVWAAAPTSVRAEQTRDGWRLTGDRPWCSGAGWCTDALVTAVAADGIRLFAVRNEAPHARPLDDTWPAVGMAGSDSRTVRFSEAPGRPVGGPEEYVNRPGFWHGGVGVAACWYGGALGVADTLLAAARRKDVGPHAFAHLGAVDVALGSARAVLAEAAAAIDADPRRSAQRLAVRVRATVEAAATEVLDRVGRALGAGPLCRDAHRLAVRVRTTVEAAATEVLFRVGRALGAGPLCRDPAHAQRVADLTVYLRQSHAEADLEHLGRLTAEKEADPW